MTPMLFNECKAILDAFGGRLLELGIVIVGEHHNPSILTPDFLRHNNIVPEEYQPDMGQIMITATMANLSYGKFTIHADMNRITIGEAVDNGEFVAPEVARQYLKHVPHVRYTALGINPVLCVDSTQGQGTKIILDRLMQKGPWSSYEGVSPAVEPKFLFTKDGGNHIHLEIISGNVRVPPVANNALIFKGNIHFGISANAGSGNVARDILGDTETHVQEFCALVGKFMEGMNK